MYSRRQQKPLPSEPPYKAFVGNLPKDLVPGDLDHLFKEFSVIEAKMVRDYDNDRFKGYAYVEFKTREDLERALSYDGCDYDKHVLRVDVADGPRGRNDRRGGGRGNFPRLGGGGLRSGVQFKGDFARGEEKNVIEEERSSGLLSSDDGSVRTLDCFVLRKCAKHCYKQGSSHEPDPYGGGGRSLDRSGGRSFESRQQRFDSRSVYGRGSQSPDPEQSVFPTSSSSRPRLQLKPRTTDPAELERRKKLEEEETRKRQARIFGEKVD